MTSDLLPQNRIFADTCKIRLSSVWLAYVPKLVVGVNAPFTEIRPTGPLFPQGDYRLKSAWKGRVEFCDRFEGKGGCLAVSQ